MKVTKEIEFCCAHRLPNYDGPCKNIHGHNYKVQVTVEGEIIDGETYEGMVIDFKILKEAMKVRIHDPFDHALVLHRDDPLINVFKKEGLLETMKVFIFDKTPTAENMARYFHDEVQLHLNNDYFKVKNVRVYETPTSWADSSE